MPISLLLPYILKRKLSKNQEFSMLLTVSCGFDVHKDHKKIVYNGLVYTISV